MEAERGLGRVDEEEALVELAKRRFRYLAGSDKFEQVGLAASAWRFLGWRSGSTKKSGSEARKGLSRLLECAATRTELVLAVASKAASLRLPEVWVSGTERRRGWAKRILPRRDCPLCGGRGYGEGRGVSLQCSPGEEAEGRSKCECAEEVVYKIPRDAANGAIVRGVCRGHSSSHFARAYFLPPSGRAPAAVRWLTSWWTLFLAVASCATILVLTEVFAPKRVQSEWAYATGWSLAFAALLLAASSVLGRAGDRTAWFFAHVPIAVGGVISTVNLLRSLVNAAQIGFPLNTTFLWGKWIGVLAALFMAARYWHRPDVMAYFWGPPNVTLVLRDDLIPASDRFLFLIGRRRFRVAIVALVVAGLVLVGIREALGPYRLVIRGMLAEKAGGYGGAIWLYEAAAASSLPARVKETMASRAYGLRLRRAERAFSSQTPIIREFPAATKDLLILASAEKVPAQVRERLPYLMWQAIDLLVKEKQWNTAQEVSKALVVRYPDHEVAQKLFNESRWELDKVVTVTPKESEPVGVKANPLFQLGEDGFRLADHSYYYARPKANHRYVEVAVRLAHLGRTRKELWAGQFSLADVHGLSYPCMGLKVTTQAAAQIEFPGLNASVPIAVSVTLLMQSQEFSGLSVGPDLCEAVLVFEVPQQAARMQLLMSGKQLTEIGLLAASD